jgi:uncharacterized membrane protein
MKGAMQAPPIGTPEPTSDERTTAMLAHVLTIFAGFLASGIIYLAKRRDSRFVAFHALQAVFWHLCAFVGFFFGMIGFFVFMAATVGFDRAPHSNAHNEPPIAFFVSFFGLWAVMMASWAVNVGFSVYLAVQASSGRWTRYPLVGSLARRIAKIPPDVV